MLDAFKRLIARKPSEPEWSEVADWAERRRLGFKRVRDEGGGFVLDGSISGKPWRLEWGPPQRKYIDGHELRIRMELGLSPNLQMLVLSQPLYETLERTAFESITESTQTVIDGNTPEEVRWIVMFPKANVKGSKALRSRFHFTARFGRVWCGWACPQTVYMEFVFRPIERLFEGAPEGVVILDTEARVVRVNSEFTRIFGRREEATWTGPSRMLPAWPARPAARCATTARSGCSHPAGSAATATATTTRGRSCGFRSGEALPQEVNAACRGSSTPFRSHRSPIERWATRSRPATAGTRTRHR